MHIEIQVALNFVISYLYNKLPRRRVNIFGEELEKALKDKFQGHWYPEKPYKGSAFRCLKTGDPIDAVLQRAARESAVPIGDILENLPEELSVWIDPGEVSYRIGEKGVVKILYSEHTDNHEENQSADREVNKTFNPEAQCFRPIDIISNGINAISFSPKTSPHAGSSPRSVSSTSPTYKGSPNPVTANGGGGGGGGIPFMGRLQAPLTFTTATFAQTKFGSTKLKTSSKRANSGSYRMSPTEFSNYIKQRAMQQQLHHGPGAATQPNHYGPIGPVSPARSLSPNPISLGLSPSADPFYLHSIANMYQQFNGHRNIFEAPYHAETNNGLYGGNNGGGHNKFGAYLDPNGFYGLGNQMQNHQQQQQQQQQHLQQQPNGIVKTTATNGGIEINTEKNSSATNNSATTTITVTVTNSSGNISESHSAALSPVSSSATVASSAATSPVSVSGSGSTNANNQDSNSSNSKLIDGLNSFYSNTTGYQQLLVAN